MGGPDVYELGDVVDSREDFVAFARALVRSAEEQPEDWENLSLLEYLDALAAWVED